VSSSRGLELGISAPIHFEFLTNMKNDALEGLRRHFENEYGVLDAARPRKKRKRDSENKGNTEKTSLDEEWNGIHVASSTKNSAPEVVAFNDISNGTEDATEGSYRSFMVYSWLTSLIIVF
jgi:hypothetical protein